VTCARAKGEGASTTDSDLAYHREATNRDLPKHSRRRPLERVVHSDVVSLCLVVPPTRLVLTALPFPAPPEHNWNFLDI
jgi:hypothetical protein